MRWAALRRFSSKDCDLPPGSSVSPGAAIRTNPLKAFQADQRAAECNCVKAAPPADPPGRAGAHDQACQPHSQRQNAWRLPLVIKIWPVHKRLPSMWGALSRKKIRRDALVTFWKRNCFPAIAGTGVDL
jgi:hypothetical protein